MYQRNREHLLENCDRLGIFPADDPESGEYDILVNCTGVGMHDSEGKSPVREKAFENACLAIDLIYKPKKSEFLRVAESEGVAILNGEGMLFYQAYYSDCIYLGLEPDEEQARKYYEKYLAEQAR
jgi:shikimate dehydrogenase